MVYFLMTSPGTGCIYAGFRLLSLTVRTKAEEGFGHVGWKLLGTTGRVTIAVDLAGQPALVMSWWFRIHRWIWSALFGVIFLLNYILSSRLW